MLAGVQAVANRIGRAPSRAEYRTRKAKTAVASSTLESSLGSWSRVKRAVRV